MVCYYIKHWVKHCFQCVVCSCARSLYDILWCILLQHRVDTTHLTKRLPFQLTFVFFTEENTKFNITSMIHSCITFVISSSTITYLSKQRFSCARYCPSITENLSSIRTFSITANLWQWTQATFFKCSTNRHQSNTSRYSSRSSSTNTTPNCNSVAYNTNNQKLFHSTRNYKYHTFHHECSILYCKLTYRVLPCGRKCRSSSYLWLYIFTKEPRMVNISNSFFSQLRSHSKQRC